MKKYESVVNVIKTLHLFKLRCLYKLFCSLSHRAAFIQMMTGLKQKSLRQKHTTCAGEPQLCISCVRGKKACYPGNSETLSLQSLL